jgi:hypothetical protein
MRRYDSTVDYYVGEPAKVPPLTDRDFKRMGRLPVTILIVAMLVFLIVDNLAQLFGGPGFLKILAERH